MEVEAAQALRATRFSNTDQHCEAGNCLGVIADALATGRVLKSESAIANVNVQVLEGSFDAVFVAFLLPPD